MFGTNEIVGRKFYQDAGGKLLVTSIFFTIQGEGPFQGQPALFIRVTHCNLACFFCDTHFSTGNWFTINQLADLALAKIHEKKYSAQNCGIVITGGEPSLQENVAPLLQLFEEFGVKFTQIETNGILPLKKLPTGTTLVVSPKCSESTGKYLEPHADVLNRAACLKFVLSADENSPYHKIPDWAFEWKRETTRPIYISPMNVYKPAALEAARQRVIERKEHNLEYRSTVDEVVSGWDDTILDREQNRQNHSWAAEYCIINGFYLTLQMQLFCSVA